MWLAAAAGRACRNLDLFMMGEDKIRESFQKNGTGADIAVIEGNMGLYDSIDAEGTGSTSDLARTLGAPVILVINTRNMTRSIAPLIQGFTQFEPDINIAGVVLNKVSGPRHEDKLRKVIERYCDMEVVGAIRRRPEMGIIMRHLGLQPALEALASREVISQIKEIISESVDLKRIQEIAETVLPLGDMEISATEFPTPLVRLGVAQDRAFTFYYPENLEALRAAGAQLVSFSPLKDHGLPPDINGLYIGGGFPEVFMRELEENAVLRQEIHAAVESGMPVYAECGGLMYLARRMTWKDETREMVGVLPCDVIMHEKPRGHGYIKLRATGAGGWFEPGMAIRGHEFHYSEITNLEPGMGYAFEVLRGTGLDNKHDGIVYKNVLASYAHLHALGSPGWAEGFISFVENTGFSLATGSRKSV
jgi:cobyrinic acid a,c-diamide synthase